MVYFKTNWIKDSNQWVIRKIRPWTILIFGGWFAFSFTYYEFLGKRVAFTNKYLDPRTPEEKQRDANKYRSRWGFKARYEPNLDISIKKEKYKNQDLKETFLDTPRLEISKNQPLYKELGLEEPEKTREMFYALLEHSRRPGTFDYTIPQTQHAVFPDVEQEAYVTLNSKDSRKLAISKYAA
jgi:hypothetical protein